MPQLIAVIGIALTALLAAREAIKAARKQRSAPVWNQELTATTVAFGWLLLFIVLVNFLGFIVAAALYVPVFLWRVSRLHVVPLGLYTLVVVGLLVLAYMTGAIDMPAGTVLPVLPFR